MEVVDLRMPKYPNRDALRQAHDIYLDAMRQFVKIRDALGMAPHDDREEIIEISDIAHLVRTYWNNFKGHFDAVDPHYEARSAIGLIVEGRNRASHPPWDLDIEFTRNQLFLIAEVLEKINMSAAQREVETIRDKLFDDTTKQLVAITVEAAKAKYERSIAEKKKRLESVEKDNKKLSKEIEAYEKRLNSTSKQLENVRAEHSAGEERLTTISNQLASTEAERNDHKKRLKTTSKELEKAKAESQVYKNSLVAMRKLFTASTIGNMVFPSFQTDTAVRIVDHRGTDKRNYLSRLLDQKHPTLIYVQSEDKIHQLLDIVGPEKAAIIGKRNAQTSPAEDAEILEKLGKDELTAIVSDTTFSTLTPSHCVEHFVFCHLVPGSDEFFKRCQPAFTSEKDAYLHLIYNSEQDMEGLVQKYPDREVLEKLYPELTNLAETNGNFIKIENLYSKLDIAKLSIETGLAIFEELQLLERNGENIKLLPPTGKKLDESEIYRRGEKLKKETADFGDFQFEHPIEQIWEKMLEKLKVDSNQMLHDSSIHKRPLRVSETEGGSLKDAQPQPEQSTEVVETDNAASDETLEARPTPKPTRANAKVTEEQVREIRARREAGESYSKLAKEFGLTPTGIRNIALRNTWKHVK